MEGENNRAERKKRICNTDFFPTSYVLWGLGIIKWISENSHFYSLPRWQGKQTLPQCPGQERREKEDSQTTEKGSRGSVPWCLWLVIAVLFICLAMPSSLQLHGLRHDCFPCPSLCPTVCSVSFPLSQQCHPIISFSVTPFSCPQSSPASGSLPMSQLFTSGGQSIGVSSSASVLLMNIQGWFPVRLINFISK